MKDWGKKLKNWEVDRVILMEKRWKISKKEEWEKNFFFSDLNDRQTILLLAKKIKAIKCKTFTQGLVGPTQLWFHQLPLGSIRSYANLVQKFIGNFFINVKISRKLEDITILQRVREPLRKYVKRFNAKYVNIPNYLESMAIPAFWLGL